jgi:hypothetical protein
VPLIYVWNQIKPPYKDASPHTFSKEAMRAGQEAVDKAINENSDSNDKKLLEEYASTVKTLAGTPAT